jgi:DNA polymerase III epsilon subunit-like protein
MSRQISMKPLRDIKYFALDLELNNKNDGTVPKIIEVGIAWGSPTAPDNIQTFNWYLDPDESITPFITKLTGITDEIIKQKSVSHEILAQEFGELLTVNNAFVNPILWGQNDASMLLNEFRNREIKFPFFGRRVFDVKHLYVLDQITLGNSTNGSLKSAISFNKMKFQGKAHTAASDALNTLRLFFHYISRQRRTQYARELLSL